MNATNPSLSQRVAPPLLLLCIRPPIISLLLLDCIDFPMIGWLLQTEPALSLYWW